MPVSELLNMHSTEALRSYKQRMMSQPPGPPDSPQNGPWEHNGETLVSSVYDRKARDINTRPELYSQLDQHLRNGTIDPVLLEGPNTRGITAVNEGHHRIIRAHQIGVEKLPVSFKADSQAHRNDWDDD
jgi:hypothetical protein